jgi:hypothetical protein
MTHGRRSRVPGPLFAWAGGSRRRQALAWVIRSLLIVVVALAAYVAILFGLVPWLIGLAQSPG